VKTALAVLSGILLGLAFPKFGVSLVAFVALLPLLLALHVPGHPRGEAVSPRAAFRLGFITGASFFLILLYWIPLLPRENVTIPYVMYPVLLVMAAYLALFPALAAAGSVWLARRGVPLGLAFPPLWTLLEVLRGSGTFGFPWGSLGYSLAAYPHIIQFAEYTGVWGVTLWVAGVNGLVHLYLDTPWVKPKTAVLAVLLVVVLSPFLHGRAALSHRQPRPGVRVGIIQPNVGNDKWTIAARDSLVDAVLEQTAELAGETAARPPDLIAWPETAVPARLSRDALYRHRVEALVDSIGIPVLVGYPDGIALPGGKFRFANSAALVFPREGLTQQYDKRHLVPFSEYFPLPFLNRFDFGQSDFTPGKQSGIMSGAEAPFGVLICFESIFPGLARGLCAEGARFLVNITNDQWFGNSAAPIQHFDMNILRCIENRTGMVRVANTGISGVIDPYGVVTMRTPTFVKLQTVGTVELSESPTFYTRYGDWIVVALLGWMLVLGAWALLHGERR